MIVIKIHGVIHCYWGEMIYSCITVMDRRIKTANQTAFIHFTIFCHFALVFDEIFTHQCPVKPLYGAIFYQIEFG